MKKNLILNSEEIKQKTKRIAYQIVEDNYDETEIVMIGIKPNGFEYAEQLKKEMEAIDSIKITLLDIELDKTQPLQNEIKLVLGKKTLDNKTVLIVDDVADTFQTLEAVKDEIVYSKGSRNVCTCVLVEKPARRKTTLAALVVLTDNQHYRTPMLEDINYYKNEQLEQKKDGKFADNMIDTSEAYLHNEARIYLNNFFKIIKVFIYLGRHINSPFSFPLLLSASLSVDCVGSLLVAVCFGRQRRS